MSWKVIAHREVTKKHVPLVEQAGLLEDYKDIVKILKEDPYQRVRNNEHLQSRQKKIRSMRINGQHRVVCTINKKEKVVTIWIAWSHYEKGIPIK